LEAVGSISVGEYTFYWKSSLWNVFLATLSARDGGYTHCPLIVAISLCVSTVRKGRQINALSTRDVADIQSIRLFFFKVCGNQFLMHRRLEGSRITMTQEEQMAQIVSRINFVFYSRRELEAFLTKCAATSARSIGSQLQAWSHLDLPHAAPDAETNMAIISGLDDRWNNIFWSLMAQ
jgi:hypothetical protein